MRIRRSSVSSVGSIRKSSVSSVSSIRRSSVSSVSSIRRSSATFSMNGSQQKVGFEEVVV